MRLGVVSLIAFLAIPSTGLANEIWLEPAKQAANKTVGNWATAQVNKKRKETHFSFHIPDDFDSFTKAIVVLIPPKTTTFPWQTNLSVSGDGQPQNAYTNSVTGSQAVKKNNVTEVDVSAVFNNSGLNFSNYVSLNFALGNNGRDTRVVGMRFQYVSLGGAQGPKGDKGEKGDTGDSGEQGPPGASGSSDFILYAADLTEVVVPAWEEGGVVLGQVGRGISACETGDLAIGINRVEFTKDKTEILTNSGPDPHWIIERLSNTEMALSYNATSSGPSCRVSPGCVVGAIQALCLDRTP